MKKAILIAVGSIGLLFAACKKDDDNSKTEMTTADLLSSATWKYDTVTLDLDKNGTPDSPLPPGYVESCDLDNTITFNSDMTGVTDEGSTKCSTDLPQTTSFTWSLKNGDSTLSIAGNANQDINLNGDITIKEISATKLVLLKDTSITVPFPLSANIIITLKK